MKKTLIFLFAITSLAAIFLAFFANHQALAVTTEFGEVNNVGQYVSNILKWAVPIIGGLAVLMLVYAGYIYVTSGGNPEALTRAKDIIIGVITGIILLFLIEVILVKTIGVKFNSTTPGGGIPAPQERNGGGAD